MPKLRERGIRTLAEAERACRALTDVLDQQHRAGWVEAVEPPRRDTERALGRVDSYPYRHRVRDVMSAPAKFVARRDQHRQRAADAWRASASPRSTSRRRDAEQPPRPAETGIVTERDVLRALAEAGAAALDAPVSAAS